MKASVQQAALVREHNWTPGGACMPLRLAIPPSTVRASTRPRAVRPHGRAMLTSVVKRGRDLLAPSPISEGGDETTSSMAGPRRLSYSSIALLLPKVVGITITSMKACCAVSCAREMCYTATCACCSCQVLLG